MPGDYVSFADCSCQKQVEGQLRMNVYITPT